MKAELNFIYIFIIIYNKFDNTSRSRHAHVTRVAKTRSLQISFIQSVVGDRSTDVIFNLAAGTAADTTTTCVRHAPATAL